MSTRNFSWGKGGRCVQLTTYHPCSAEMSRKSGALTYPEPLGPPRPVAGHLYFTLHGNNNVRGSNMWSLKFMSRYKHWYFRKKGTGNAKNQTMWDKQCRHCFLVAQLRVLLPSSLSWLHWVLPQLSIAVPAIVKSSRYGIRVAILSIRRHSWAES